MGMRPSDKAWAVMAMGILTYELTAKEGELMSHAADRWLDRHPVIPRLAFAIVALHLMNWLPIKVDPLNQPAIWRRELRRKLIRVP